MRIRLNNKINLFKIDIALVRSILLIIVVTIPLVIWVFYNRYANNVLKTHPYYKEHFVKCKVNEKYIRDGNTYIMWVRNSDDHQFKKIVNEQIYDSSKLHSTINIKASKYDIYGDHVIEYQRYIAYNCIMFMFYLVCMVVFCYIKDR